MNNFELATEATATALNSQGSSMREQAKYADSLEARINRLDTAWNKLTLSAGSAFLTDGLIATIETLGDLAGITNSYIKTFGVLSGVFGTLGVAVVLLSTRFRTFATSLFLGTEGMTRATLASAGLTAGMSRLGIAAIGARAALTGLLVASGVGIAFALVGVAIEKLISAYSNAKQKQEEFEESQKKNIDALTENKKQTEELIATYKTLSEQQGKAGWNTDKEKEYLRIQQQLGEIFPSLISSIDATGQNHLIAADRIDKEVEATKKLLELKKEEVKLKALETFEDNIDKRDGFFGLEKDIERKKEQIADSIKVGVKASDVNQLKQELLRMESELATTSLKINDHVLKVAEAYSKLEVDPTIKKSVQDLVSSLDLTDLSASELEAYSMKVSKLMDDMQRAYENADGKGFDNAKTALTDYVQSMGATDVQASVLGVTFEKVKENADRLAGATYSGADGMDAFTDSMGEASEQSKDFAKSFDDAVSKIESLNGIINDLNEGKGVSADSISTLIESYPELLEYINDEATLRTKISEIIDQEAKVAKQAMVEKLKYSETFYINTLKNNKTFVDQLNKTYGIDLNAYKDLNSAKIAVDNATRERLSKAWETFYQNISAAARASSDGMEVMTGALMNRAQNIMSEQTKVSTDFNDIFLDQVEIITDGSIAQSGLSDATSKSSKEYEHATYVSDKFKQSLERINLELEKQKKIQAQFPKRSQEYQKSLKNEISLLDQKKKLLQDQAKALDSQIKSGKIAQTGQVVTTKSSTASYTSGGSNSAQIWNFFKSKGFTDSIAAGIMGNLQLESGLNPNALNKSSGAFGIAQWLGGRKNALQSYAKSVGSSINDLNTQLEFLWNELNSTEKRTLTYLNGNKGASASNIAAAFDRLFERSEGTHIPQRQQYANQFLSQYAGTAGSKVASEVSKDVAENLQNVDQAKSELIQLKQDLLAIEAEIAEKQYQSIIGVLDVLDYRIKNIEYTYNTLEGKLDNYDPSSQQYRNTTQQMSDTLYQKQRNNASQINYVETIIKQGGLDPVKIDELTTKLQELRLEREALFDQQKELSAQKVDSFISQYGDILDDINDKLELTQMKLGSLEQGTEEYNAVLSDEIALLSERQEANKLQIKTIENLLKTQKLSIAKQKELQELIVDLNKQIQADEYEKQSIMRDSADAIIDIYKKSIEKRRDIEVAALRKELEEAEKAHDAKMKMYDEDMDRYEEIVNRKLGLIDDQVRDDQYNKDLGKLQGQEADIQKQINRLMMDDSQEAIAKRIELEQQLKDIQEQIAQKQYDREVELRKDGLQDELDRYKEEIEGKKDAEQEKFDAVKDNLENQIEQVNYYYNEMLADEQRFAEMYKELMKGNVDVMKGELTGFLDFFKGQNADLIKELGLSWTELGNLMNGISGGMGNLGNFGGSTGSNSGTVNKAKEAAWKEYLNNKRLAETGNPTPERAAQLRAANDQLRSVWGFPDGRYNDLKNLKKYHDGGIVGGGGSKLANLINSLANSVKPNESIVKALKGEVMIPQKNLPNFVRNISNALIPRSPSPSMAGGAMIDKLINIENFYGTKQEVKSLENRLVNTLKNNGIL